MRIRRPVLDAIVRHARRASPEECCGLLIGSDTEIIETVATANVADEPRRRYEIDPADFMAQIWRCRQITASGGAALAVVGAYHSHPHSPPEPSPTDVERAFTNFLFLIAGPAGGVGQYAVRAYELIDGNLQPVELVPDAEVADH
jgi:proteasome lid subunit RPN8/RPN11